ncbi:hypothetical protein WJX72_006672 [[Myrmecia] bisecta]|uniref:Uncharacterized protein n=1 Tax=[Myrmecia] bisecta TaxID=41462 RepID=A0AAW1QFF7_9CHLO
MLIMRGTKGTADEHGFGLLRHSDPMRCGVGGLARYLVYRNDIKSDSMISNITEQIQNIVDSMKAGNTEGVFKLLKDGQLDWWTEPLITCKDASMNYTQVHRELSALYSEADIINKGACAHLNRHTRVVDNIMAGHTHLEAGTAGNWGQPGLSSAMMTYSKVAPQPGSLMTNAGFPNDMSKYYQYRQGSTGDINADLNTYINTHVFKGLDALEAVCNEMSALARPFRHLARSYYEDLSAMQLVTALKFLRQVYIEDAIILQPRFTGFPAYGHPIFAPIDCAQHMLQQISTPIVTKREALKLLWYPEVAETTVVAAEEWTEVERRVAGRLNSDIDHRIVTVGQLLTDWASSEEGHTRESVIRGLEEIRQFLNCTPKNFANTHFAAANPMFDLQSTSVRMMAITCDLRLNDMAIKRLEAIKPADGIALVLHVKNGSTYGCCETLSQCGVLLVTSQVQDLNELLKVGNLDAAYKRLQDGQPWWSYPLIAEEDRSCDMHRRLNQLFKDAEVFAPIPFDGEYTSGSLIPDVLLRRAHFSGDLNKYFLFRQGSPSDLDDYIKSVCFADLAALEAATREMHNLAIRYKRGNKLIYQDTSAIAFVQTLKFLQQVFVEDAAIFYPLMQRSRALKKAIKVLDVAILSLESV